jgi:hypothetical protein
MPGPPPKDPATRRNRRHVPGQTTLVPLRPGDVVRPRMPPCPSGGAWHPAAKAEWDLFWSSPMARQVQEADYGAFVRYLSLVDLLWRMMHGGDAPLDVRAVVQLSAEIRRQGQAFGLSPLDRWRLKWQIETTQSSTERRAVRRRADPRLGEERE